MLPGVVPHYGEGGGFFMYFFVVAHSLCLRPLCLCSLIGGAQTPLLSTSFPPPPYEGGETPPPVFSDRRFFPFYEPSCCL